MSAEDTCIEKYLLMTEVERADPRGEDGKIDFAKAFVVGQGRLYELQVKRVVDQMEEDLADGQA